MRYALLLLLVLTACHASRGQPKPRSTPTPTVFTQKDISVNWIYPSERPTTFHYHSGAETITITYQGGFSNPHNGTSVQVDVGRAMVFSRSYSGLSPLRISFVGIPGLHYPLVDVRLYSGGAHCCYSDALIEAQRSAADTYAAVRDWGDYPADWKRVGADRHYALTTVRGTAYDFSGFGSSTGPIMVYDWRSHGLQDSSIEYPRLLEADARQHITEYNLENERGTAGEASLVSYLADEYRLGRPSEGWQRVRQLYQGRDGDTSDFAAHANTWLHDERLDVTPTPRPTSPTQ